MDKASFSFLYYTFDKIILDCENLSNDVELNISFHPSGEFLESDSSFKLIVVFEAREKENLVINVVCKSVFKFNGVLSIEEIPEYFYANSIAILFPYIRAMVSTVTLQANMRPLILPTLNLSSLKEILKKNTAVSSQ